MTNLLPQVCQKPFESTQYRACCSDACQVIHKRGIYRDEYYRRVEKNPQHNRQRALRVKALTQADPARLAAVQAAEKQRQEREKERLATDPAYREHVNALARKLYQERAHPF